MALFGLAVKTAVVIGSGAAIKWWWNKPYVHPLTKATMKEIAAAQREDEECDEMVTLGDLLAPTADEDVTAVRSGCRGKYANRVATNVRAQVGLLELSAANRLVYQRLCREEMVNHKVRPTHIAQLLPIAVAACFVPSSADLLASSMLRSSQYRKLRNQLGGVNSSK